MAITDSQKVDFLYKKIGAGVAKTDTSAFKSPSNEANASPLLTRGDTIWQQSVSIPVVKPASNSSVLVLYQDTLTSTIECVLDTSASGTNRTWFTNQVDWIGSEFGATYQVQVYAAAAGNTAPQTYGTQLFSDGSGNADTWFFDYQSGILNFPDTNVPTAVTGKKIYIAGARYVGQKGISNFTSGITMGNITISGNNINSSSGNVTITANLNIIGNTTFYGYSDLTITDSILNLHTQANLAPWTVNDGKDIGLKMHYYDGIDSHAALVRANDTGYLEWYARGTEISGNTFSGNAYGTIKTGALIVANTTPATGPNTGALQVYGGASISGNLYTGNLQASLGMFAAINNTPIGNAVPSTGVFTTLDTITANIGNLRFANTTVTHANVFVFNSNSAIQVPTGGTAERPAGANGMIRYNTDTPALEYFDGSIWVPITNTITDQQITGDGASDTFTLDRDSSTVGVIVSINGTLQQPNSAYYVHDGNLITFNEIPEPTDIIDIRFLGAAVTISSTLSDDLTVIGNLTVLGNTTIGSAFYGNIIPAADVTYSLGSASRRWKNLYISGNTINIGSSTLKVIDGVLLLDDAPIVGGNVGSVYGNVQVAAYLAVNKPTGTYSNANVASYLTVNKPTGTYSNTNVAAYLTGNVTTGNVFSTAYYYANGMPFVGGSTYSNATVAAYLVANPPAGTYSNTNVAGYLAGNITTGNVFSRAYYYANGMPFVSGTIYSGANVKSYLTSFDGNIIPASNVTYTLGNVTHWWTEVWLSSNTIYVGGKPLSFNPIGNVVTYNNTVIGGIKYTEATVAPLNPRVGDQWYDTDTDVLYEYLDTGSVNTWVDITGPVGVAGPGGLQGAQGSPGVNGNDGTSVIILGSVPTFQTLPTWGNLTYGAGFIVQSTGNLAVYDGSAFQDVGQIKGPKGDTGLTGNTGVGVDTVVVTAGNLLVTLSNTYVINAGNITGPQGTPGINATNYLNFGNLSANSNLNMNTGTLTFTGYNGVVIGITANTANIGLSGNVELTSVTSKFAEPVITGNIPSNYTPDWNLGSIHNYTAIQNFTLNSPVNMPVGAAMTIVVTQDSNGGRAMTPNVYYKFASNIRTLSTGANSVDMMNFVRTGANTYLTVLTKGYA